MTVLERKIRFVKAILDDTTTENVLSDLELIYSLIAQNEYPCQYNSDEIRERAKQGIWAAKQGYGKTIEEMRNKYPMN